MSMKAHKTDGTVLTATDVCPLLMPPQIPSCVVIETQEHANNPPATRPLTTIVTPCIKKLKWRYKLEHVLHCTVCYKVH